MCNLLLEEMSIKQQIKWDCREMHGYVNIFCIIIKSGYCLPEAKEALVFLVTAINGTWKVPVGYVFVDGVTG